jgi:hypothetical protein
MAFIPRETERGSEEGGLEQRGMTLADRVRTLERERRLFSREVITEEKTKQFKWPWKWRRKFSQSKKKDKAEMMLVIFLNKKNQIEPPKFMPIFDGNMIVWKNKPYEFDPRAVWVVRGMKGTPQAYLIKEIDRRPVRNKYGQNVYRDAAVSNQDLDEIRERGDSTESDEFLIKAALKAQTSQVKKNFNVAILVVVGLVVLGIVAYLMFGK